MKFIKATEVPLPVTLFVILMGIGGTVIGLQALFDPTTTLDFVEGADKMGIAWGGRNTGLGVVALTAVALRNVFTYVAAFAGALFREISDLIASLSDGGSFTSATAIVLVLLTIEVACIAIRLKNARQLKTTTSA